MNTYPAWVFSHNEDITRRNMRQYDNEQNRIYNECIRIAPSYHKLGLREQTFVRETAKQNLGLAAFESAFEQRWFSNEPNLYENHPFLTA